ncbi:MAG: hypothetical protein ACREMP_07490 [Candidatus Tyrphobacter sp.]
MVLDLLVSLALAVVCVAAAYAIARVNGWLVALGTLVCLALWVYGFAHSLRWYPWVSVVDVLLAIGLGALLGRAVPARFTPFCAMLVILSVLDALQVSLGAHHAKALPRTPLSPGALYANVTFWIAGTRYAMGPVDLLVMTAIGTYWSRRGARGLRPFVGLAVGLVLAYAWLAAHQGSVLALIPFLSFGWLVSAVRLPMRRAKAQGAR